MILRSTKCHRRVSIYVAPSDASRGGEFRHFRPEGAESAPSELRLLLADDHTLVAEAVAAVLAKTGRFSIEIVENYGAVLSALSGDESYDIVMLDVRMPGSSGIDSVKRVISVAGDARVVLFTAHAEIQLIRRAVEIGACGVIPKTLPLQSLDSVLMLINSGQTFMPMSLMESEDNTNAENLSQVELLVLKFAAEGMTNKRIANDIGVSEATVKMHMRTICKKLGASNRAHAAILARDRAILDV
jgi:two-component system nitrate/nitrite response regulator NarL